MSLMVTVREIFFKIIFFQEAARTITIRISYAVIGLCMYQWTILIGIRILEREREREGTHGDVVWLFERIVPPVPPACQSDKNNDSDTRGASRSIDFEPVTPDDGR